MVQAEYVKEWTETYLQIPCETTNAAEYEEKMLYYNPNQGCLECSREFVEGQTVYRYKVTGKKALQSIYATLAVKEVQLRSILQQVIALLDMGKEYLLCEDSFLLEPKYMFTSLPELKLEFCYLSGYHKPLAKQLEGFLEYLLNRVDYEDKKAVELLYDCYVLCTKEAGLESLKERIEAENGKEYAAEEYVRKSYPPQATPSEFAIDQTSYTSWLTGLFRRGKKHKEELYVLEQDTTPPLLVAEERTVLLSAKTPALREEKRPQLLNEKTGELIFLTKTPFYIGSMEGYADAIMKQKGISRLHACISQKEGEYYLSDLNSTNGTFLNQAEVLPGTEERLIANDVLRLAKEEFVFSL